MLPAWVCGYESCIAIGHFDFPEEAKNSEKGTGPGSRVEDSGTVSSTVLLGGRHFTTSGFSFFISKARVLG